jgi:hypothetical protein
VKKLLRAAWLRITTAYVEWKYQAMPSEKHFTPDTSPCRIAPPRTFEMKMRGTIWAQTVEGGWREVCDTCGGNCGQCGMTERLGNPGFSLDRIIAKTGMNNPVNGIGAARQQ